MPNSSKNSLKHGSISRSYKETTHIITIYLDFFLVRIQPKSNQLERMTIDLGIRLKIFKSEPNQIYIINFYFFKCWSYLYFYVIYCIFFAFYVHHTNSIWHFYFPFSHNPKMMPHTLIKSPPRVFLAPHHGCWHRQASFGPLSS